jgi:hypothetical protein
MHACLIPEHTLLNPPDVDQWGYDVLGLAQKLLLRESARAKSRRLPRRKGPNGTTVVVKEKQTILIANGNVTPASTTAQGQVVTMASEQQGVLTMLGIHLFHRHDCSSIGVPDQDYLAFLQRIELLYNPCSYHNSMHGADAMRTIHYFYVASPLGGHLNALEKFAGLIAGAVHDVKHPGTNNNFIVTTNHPIAITYNDQSPLENMHCATAFGAAKDTKVLDNIPPADRAMLRKQIVSMVLQTDLALHFSTLAKFNQRLKNTVAEVGADNPGMVLGRVMADNDGRTMAMCMVMKTADIAHAAKPWTLHEKWSKRMLLEFWAQGDAERQRGMPVSSLCDREGTDVWKAQSGFIDFLVRLVLPYFLVILVLVDAGHASVQCH